MRSLARILAAAALALGMTFDAAQAVDLLLDVKIAEAIEAGTPDAALALVEAELAANSDPMAAEALLQRLAQLQVELGRPAAAGEAYLRLAAQLETRLGRLAPERAGALERAGNQFALAADLERAISAYVDAIRIDVENGAKAKDHRLMAAIDALIEGVANRRERVRLEAQRTALLKLDASVRSAPDKAPQEPGYRMVRIYYATNRARVENVRASETYGAERGEVDYGTAEISIPKSHVPGALEAPSIFTLDMRENPDQHIILAKVEPRSKDEVFALMRKHLSDRHSNEAFVFVHGFNVTFADGARRTAQMAYDMGFEGLPIMYSWPSQGQLFGYLADSAVIQLSGRKLSAFLEDVVRDTGATRIHLVAHSMGNRALTEALELFALRHKGEPPAFDQVLFTAPDLDAGLFAAMTETIRPAVGRMTLYTSQNDWALRVSHQLHGPAPRAGEGTPGAAVAERVDSIDMSVLGEDMLAHNYFADDTSALTDILSLFWRDAPPVKRCGMTLSNERPTSAEWTLEPTLCDGNAMLTALRLLRSERIGTLQQALSEIETRFTDATPERRAQLEAALARLFQP